MATKQFKLVLKIKGKKDYKSKQKKPFRYLKEFRVDDPKNYQLGQEINVSIFKEGDLVSVSGISKGKGFQGGVKRWGFSGRPSSHGTKHEERTLGSVGASTPSRVIKGKKMPGRTGGERVTIKNLEIVKIEKKRICFTLKEQFQDLEEVC
jgi:large subunit ribosomal protein L3